MWWDTCETHCEIWHEYCFYFHLFIMISLFFLFFCIEFRFNRVLRNGMEVLHSSHFDTDLFSGPVSCEYNDETMTNCLGGENYEPQIGFTSFRIFMQIVQYPISIIPLLKAPSSLRDELERFGGPISIYSFVPDLYGSVPICTRSFVGPLVPAIPDRHWPING